MDTVKTESADHTMPAVSVIVPVYNVKDYLDRCISSLTGQTFANIEIILVDDGSCDGSGQICDRYAAGDPRIKVIHKANAGQGLARNDGLLAASGEYISFLDSDDYYEPDACGELYRAVTKADADMCSYGYEIDSPTGSVVRIPYITERTYTGEEVKRTFLLHFFGDDPADKELRGFSSCMSVFKRSVIEKYHITFPSERKVLTEDTVFCLEFCRHAETVITVPEVYYHYCQKADSFSQAYDPQKMKKTMDMYRILCGYAEDFGLYREDKAPVQVRLAMYVWVNLMATLKAQVRAAGPDGAENDIEKNVCDPEIRTVISCLSSEKLPLKQKLLLWAVMKRKTGLVSLLCDIRGRLKL